MHCTTKVRRMALELSGSIAALVTPMAPDGSLDLSAWERLLEWHYAQGTDGIVVGGTTGESPTLTLAEVVKLVSLAKACFAGRPVLAGSGTNSTATTIERGQALAAAGADALLVVTPYYNKPTQTGLIAHFKAVAAGSAVPIVLYNVPGRTAVDLLPQTVQILADEPQIVALKESTNSVPRIQDLVDRVGERFTILCGDDPVAAASMLAGARGVISVTANVVPRAMHEMALAALAGDADRALALDGTLRTLHDVLFVEPNPIPTKWALEQLGRIGSGIRLPLTPLSAQAQAVVAAALAAL